MEIARLHQEIVLDTSEVDSGRSDSETVSAEFVRRSGTGRRKKNVPFQSPIHSSVCTLYPSCRPSEVPRAICTTSAAPVPPNATTAVKRSKNKQELQGPCCHCHAASSPQWRKGPKGKPILCNACGIRFLRTRSLGKTTPSKVMPKKRSKGTESPLSASPSLAATETSTVPPPIPDFASLPSSKRIKYEEAGTDEETDMELQTEEVLDDTVEEQPASSHSLLHTAEVLSCSEEDAHLPAGRHVIYGTAANTASQCRGFAPYVGTATGSSRQLSYQPPSLLGCSQTLRNTLSLSLPSPNLPLLNTAFAAHADASVSELSAASATGTCPRGPSTSPGIVVDQLGAAAGAGGVATPDYLAQLMEIANTTGSIETALSLILSGTFGLNNAGPAMATMASMASLGSVDTGFDTAPLLGQQYQQQQSGSDAKGPGGYPVARTRSRGPSRLGQPSRAGHME